MKKALSAIFVVATRRELCAFDVAFDRLFVVHSLRRRYPDQVRGVDGDVTVLSAGLLQLPRYLNGIEFEAGNLGLTRLRFERSYFGLEYLGGTATLRTSAVPAE